jgi:glycopeptide antibiotics resistance protein
MFARWFPVLFVAFGITQATLLPYAFAWPAQLHWPSWYIGLRDVAQNILLFSPFGTALCVAFGWRPLLVLLIGACLSSSVEAAQLFIPGRTSNFQDIVSNSLGTLAGLIVWRWFVPVPAQRHFGIALGCMIVVLAWLVCTRALDSSIMVWLVLPLAVACFAMLAHAGLGLIGHFIWASAFVPPLVYLTRHAVLFAVGGLAVTSGLVISVMVLAMPLFFYRKPPLVSHAAWILLAVAAVVVVVNGLWFAWQPSPIVWHFMSHLRWIETLCAVAVAGFAMWVARSKATGVPVSSSLRS